MKKESTWYKDSVVYQIYPRSFCDSNGDGLGDINGIISKLDYIASLGINCVWLSPCYPSPNKDFGYDISDYYAINPEYGTMEDFDRLLSGLHSRGIKLFMDLVVNHTSSEHLWFKEAIKSVDSPYHDFYIWRKAKANGKLPNNWSSTFTGPAWEYNKATDEYYLHLFTKEQPDLNWENPKVREEVIKIVNFWFDKGVDGFRCDVLSYISKADGLPDDSAFSFQKGEKYYASANKIHEYIHLLNTEAFGKRDKFFLGECPDLNVEKAKLYTARDREEMDVAFSFEQVNSLCTAKFIPKKFDLIKFKKPFTDWQNALADTGWNTIYLENHDQARSVSRYGDDEHFRKESAKALATMLATLKGTLFIYEGQELGLKNYKFKSIDEYQDPVSHFVYGLVTKFLPKKLFLSWMTQTARDNARYPMHWTSEKNAGFTTSDKPWMSVNDDYESWNAAAEEQDETSVLAFYRELLAFRKAHPVILDGTFKEYLPKSKAFYAYERKNADERLLVVTSFSKKTETLPSIEGVQLPEKVFGNYATSIDPATFRPYETKIFVL